MLASLLACALASPSFAEDSSETARVIVERVATRCEQTPLSADEAVRAFSSVPPDDARAALRARLARSPARGSSLAALAWVGASGAARDVELAREAASFAPRDESVVAAFQSSLAALFARDAGAFAFLDGELASAPAELREPYVIAVETSAAELAPARLASWAESQRDLRRSALARLGRLCAQREPPFDDAVTSPVRRLIESGDPDALQEAILCAGKLADPGAIPSLIALLGHFHAGVRADALWALRRASGLRLPSKPERWLAWFADEQRFWSERAETTWDELANGNRAARLKAIGEISRLRLRRPEIAAKLALVLTDPDSEIAVLAAREIGRTGSRAARAALVDALERGDHAVAVAAWHALRSTEGLDVPLDAEAWRAALSPVR